MATGGMGDVLSGVLGSLLAQKIPTHHAAPLGAWLCGRAAEHAALHQHPNATLPTSVATHLGHALRDLTELAF
jgi:NAD(P)H-hydrate epimerase